jgi:hypothetical protein
LLLGYPEQVHASARFSATGIDSSCYMMFKYANSAKALLYSTFEANTPLEAYIYGTEGTLKLHRSFHHSEKISLFQNGKLNKEYDIKYEGNGFVHEIEEVNRCLLEKKKESHKLTHHDSLQLMRLMDQVKDQIALTYEY